MFSGTFGISVQPRLAGSRHRASIIKAADILAPGVKVGKTIGGAATQIALASRLGLEISVLVAECNEHQAALNASAGRAAAQRPRAAEFLGELGISPDQPWTVGTIGMDGR